MFWGLATSQPKWIVLDLVWRLEHGVWKSQKKVSFNIVSEASYVYILSGQKFNKNAENGQFLRVFENLKLEVKQF